MPWEWNELLVKRSLTTPWVSLPLRWFFFRTIITAIPGVISSRCCPFIDYFFEAFFSCFSAFFSFGVLAEAFFTAFLLSWPLPIDFAPYCLRLWFVFTIYHHTLQSGTGSGYYKASLQLVPSPIPPQCHTLESVGDTLLMCPRTPCLSLLQCDR